MKLQQLSLFLENQPGVLRAPMELLASKGINVLTMSLADTAQFGILRFIVADPEAARKLLTDAGMVVRMTEVVPVEVDNQPGGLARALAAIEQAGLAVEYMYDFGAACRTGKAAIVFRFENPDAAIKALQAAGVRIFDASELLPK